MLLPNNSSCGVVWCGVVWCGVVWCGVVWCGVATKTREVSECLSLSVLLEIMRGVDVLARVRWRVALLD